MKTIQYFSDEYLKQCQAMTLEQKIDFLENFRQLQQKDSPSKLISIKIPENLLPLILYCGFFNRPTELTMKDKRPPASDKQK